MLLRIEDSDRARNTLDGAAAIAEDLQWLGCKWRQVPPQSARLDDYEKQMQKLQDGNWHIPVFVRRKNLTASDNNAPPPKNRRAISANATI